MIILIGVAVGILLLASRSIIERVREQAADRRPTCFRSRRAPIIWARRPLRGCQY